MITETPVRITGWKAEQLQREITTRSIIQIKLAYEIISSQQVYEFLHHLVHS
jgi:hypothetical protein